MSSDEVDYIPKMTKEMFESSIERDHRGLK